MRFSLASVFFIVAGFIFLVLWGFFTLYLKTIYDALEPMAVGNTVEIMENITTAFGVICALFFVVGIVLIFVLDSFAEEPELYWR